MQKQRKGSQEKLVKPWGRVPAPPGVEGGGCAQQSEADL